METTNQMLFAHALIVLPNEKVLLRKWNHQDGRIGKWTATIEKGISKEDSPYLIITKAVMNDFGIDMADPATIRKVTIRSFSSIDMQRYHRRIFPFIVDIKQVLTLRSSIEYKFLATPFSIIAKDILDSDSTYHKLSEVAYTLNTVRVIKEVHLKDVLTYANICTNIKKQL